MINKNEEILDILEDKPIEDYVDDYYEIENKIKDKLSKLKNDGVECDCKDSDYIKFIHDGIYEDEIHLFCLECGGWKENGK